MHAQKKLKILFLSHAANLAGAEICLLDLLKCLNKDRYESLVLVAKEGPLKNKISELGIKVVYFPIPRWIATRNEYSRWHFRKVIFELLARIRFLNKLISREKIDIIYTNTITIIDGAISAKIKRLPHIWHIHEIIYRDSALIPYLPFPFIKFLVNKFSSKIIVVSNAVARAISFKNNGKFSKKISIIYNGVDTKVFSQTDTINKESKVRIDLKVEEKTKLVVLIGSFIKEKGHIDFIKAAKIISLAFNDVKFTIIGDGNKEYKNKLIDMVSKLGLKDKTYFLDFREDIIPIYHSMDMLVSASWNEALPRTIMEAMSCGKPVVATQTEGAKEMVADNKTGFLVSIKSPEELAEAVIRLLSDSQLALYMGRLARQRAIQLFSLERYISNIEEVIDEVAQQRNFALVQ
jgi:glycosyltransferase involved in cell wall biosynthesis